jgi:ubiquinone/menaquinone biosynthesis C-methylase UbiE
MPDQPGHHGHRFGHIERLRSPERLERMEVERVTDLALEGLASPTILDIGTGTGLFAESFARRGLSVPGVDAHPEMLEPARAFVPGADFRQAVAESLPFPDRAFDLAFMGLVLHETDDPLKALQEASRVSKSRLVVLEWPYVQEDAGPGIEERFRPEELQIFGKQAGFARITAIPLKKLVLYRLEQASDHGSI